MHIMDGYLPLPHALTWTVVAAPFVVHSFGQVRRLQEKEPEKRLLLSAMGGYMFILTALKIPSVTGSCSHPTGTGLGALLIHPRVMPALGTVVLLFQAILLAHGGLTTLGANIFSMAVVGPWVAWGLYRALRKLNLPQEAAIIAAVALGDLATYVVSSFQLALAFPGSLLRFLGIFALTQVPIALAEGLLAVLLIEVLKKHFSQELKVLEALQ